MSRPAIKTEALAGRIRQSLSNLTVPQISLKSFKTHFGFKSDPVDLFTDSLKLVITGSGFERRGPEILRETEGGVTATSFPSLAWNTKRR